MTNHSALFRSILPKLRIVSTFLLIVLLNACDGGIFGTGDGEEGTLMQPGISAEESTPGSPVQNPTSPSPGPAPEPTDPSAQSSNPSIEFSNSTVATERNDALVRVIHADADLQDNIVVTLNGMRDNPLLPLPGLSFIDGVDIIRPLQEQSAHILRIYSAEAFRANSESYIVAIDPLDIGKGTISTVILRTSESSTASEILLPLPTLSTAIDNTSAIRIAHSAKNFSANGSVDVYLHEPNSSIDGLAPAFPNLDFTNSAASDYVNFTADSYQLTITPSNEGSVLYSAPTLIDLNTNQVLTLVLRDDPTMNEQGVSILQIDDSSIPAQ